MHKEQGWGHVSSIWVFSFFLQSSRAGSAVRALECSRGCRDLPSPQECSQDAARCPGRRLHSSALGGQAAADAALQMQCDIFLIIIIIISLAFFSICCSFAFPPPDRKSVV